VRDVTINNLLVVWRIVVTVLVLFVWIFSVCGICAIDESKNDVSSIPSLSKDVANLIVLHNTMEDRISSLEKRLAKVQEGHEDEFRNLREFVLTSGELDTEIIAKINQSQLRWRTDFIFGILVYAILSGIIAYIIVHVQLKRNR
jgi:predicted PurR-regulated permease PerM